MPQKESLHLSSQLRVHQLFCDQTGFSCPENGDSNPAGGKSWTWIQVCPWFSSLFETKVLFFKSQKFLWDEARNNF